LLGRTKRAGFGGGCSIGSNHAFRAHVKRSRFAFKIQHGATVFHAGDMPQPRSEIDDVLDGVTH
jgi:hypothetical protein